MVEEKLAGEIYATYQIEGDKETTTWFNYIVYSTTIWLIVQNLQYQEEIYFGDLDQLENEFTITTLRALVNLDYELYVKMGQVIAEHPGLESKDQGYDIAFFRAIRQETVGSNPDIKKLQKQINVIITNIGLLFALYFNEDTERAHDTFNKVFEGKAELLERATGIKTLQELQYKLTSDDQETIELFLEKLLGVLLHDSTNHFLRLIETAVSTQDVIDLTVSERRLSDIISFEIDDLKIIRPHVPHTGKLKPIPNTIRTESALSYTHTRVQPEKTGTKIKGKYKKTNNQIPTTIEQIRRNTGSRVHAPGPMDQIFYSAQDRAQIDSFKDLGMELFPLLPDINSLIKTLDRIEEMTKKWKDTSAVINYENFKHLYSLNRMRESCKTIEITPNKAARGFLLLEITSGVGFAIEETIDLIKSIGIDSKIQTDEQLSKDLFRLKIYFQFLIQKRTESTGYTEPLPGIAISDSTESQLSIYFEKGPGSLYAKGCAERFKHNNPALVREYKKRYPTESLKPVTIESLEDLYELIGSIISRVQNKISQINEFANSNTADLAEQEQVISRINQMREVNREHLLPIIEAYTNLSPLFKIIDKRQWHHSAIWDNFYFSQFSNSPSPKDDLEKILDLFMQEFKSGLLQEDSFFLRARGKIKDKLSDQQKIDFYIYTLVMIQGIRDVITGPIAYLTPTSLGEEPESVRKRISIIITNIDKLIANTLVLLSRHQLSKNLINTSYQSTNNVLQKIALRNIARLSKGELIKEGYDIASETAQIEEEISKLTKELGKNIEQIHAQAVEKDQNRIISLESYKGHASVYINGLGPIESYGNQLIKVNEHLDTLYVNVLPLLRLAIQSSGDPDGKLQTGVNNWANNWTRFSDSFAAQPQNQTIGQSQPSLRLQNAVKIIALGLKATQLNSMTSNLTIAAKTDALRDGALCPQIFALNTPGTLEFFKLCSALSHSLDILFAPESMRDPFNGIISENLSSTFGTYNLEGISISSGAYKTIMDQFKLNEVYLLELGEGVEAKVNKLIDSFNQSLNSTFKLLNFYKKYGEFAKNELRTKAKNKGMGGTPNRKQKTTKKKKKRNFRSLFEK